MYTDFVMAANHRLSTQYFSTLALLNQALNSLDDLGEGIAAAHLSSVIDMVTARMTDTSMSHH